MSSEIASEGDVVDDRLFVPLMTEHYRNFESGTKTIELRGINPQFNEETVVVGRPVELRRGYSTDDSLWGEIAKVWTFEALADIPKRLDHTAIHPSVTQAEFLDSAAQLLGDYERYIAFQCRGVLE